MTCTVILVTPVDEGWAVEAPSGAPPLVFPSGASAEAKAVELSRVAARRGARAEVRVRDRSGEMIATLSFEPDPPHPTARPAPALRWTPRASGESRAGLTPINPAAPDART